MSFVRQCPRSPAAALEDDDLLTEILLRLSPLPSSLPRASAVCNRWRRLVSDPGFVRRFRRRHRRNPPPILGFFRDDFYGIDFEPTMEAPNRVPPRRFSMLSDARIPPSARLLGCRHGLVLMFDYKLKEALVWDPVACKQHSLAVPPWFTSGDPVVGAVLRAVGDAHHFRVVLAGTDQQQQHTRAFACIYSSETDVWSDLITIVLPSPNSRPSFPSMRFTSRPAVLAGDSLYWTVTRSSNVILEFNLDRQSLAVIHLPLDIFALCKPLDFAVMPAEGGGLGLIFKSDMTAQLWKMNTDYDGAASWVLGRTIELGKLLSLNSVVERNFLRIIGFAEDNNVVFLYTSVGLFMVHLESLKFKKFPSPSSLSWCHAFESIYAAGI